MKIAINALSLPGNLAGTGFYMRKLVENVLILEPSFKITIFTNRGAIAGLEGLENVIFRVVNVESLLIKSLWALLILPFKLKEFEILHSIGNVGLPFCPIPQVVTIHDFCQRIIPGRFGFFKRAYLNIGQSWMERSVNQIIVVSESTQKDLKRFHPSCLAMSTIIHSASKYLIDKTGPITGGGFLFVGTLEPGKNLEMMISALVRLKETHGIIKSLSIIGAKGWKQTKLPRLIEELGLERQMNFMGYLNDEELRQQYQSAECLVFPSVYEGFGLPILEAQSQGCPVISADNSSLREIGGEGACYYFPTNDLDGLVDLLFQSQKDPVRFRTIRESGFKNCVQFTWTKTAAATIGVYKQMV